MILSVSRRTDIPNYYSEWFFNRIKERFVYVRNPMNEHQVSKIDLSPDVVDCIVFWTKNPEPMITRLDELSEYSYYFQFTLTGYGKDIECNVPHKKEKMIPIFQELSSKIGKQKVIWRYDPILFTKKYTPEYHLKAFGQIAEALKGYTEKCVISFVDLYKKTITNTKIINLQEPSQSEMRYLAEKFVNIARKYGIQVLSCAESINLSEEGVEHGCCIDPNLIDICGYHIDVKKDKNQREECGCVESIDIGAYNTCCHACAYCYANFNNEKVRSQSSKHHKNSSLLIGDLSEDDVIKIRKVGLLKSHRLF